jgi:hypothetical protein
MINYRAGGKDLYTAWFIYKATPSIGGKTSVQDFVAGYNAALAGMKPEPVDSAAKTIVLGKYPSAYASYTPTRGVYEIWVERKCIGVGDTEELAWELVKGAIE